MSNSSIQEVSIPNPITSDEYLTRRVQNQIDWYDKKSVWNQKCFKRLRIVEIIAAAMIPLLTALTEPIITKIHCWNPRSYDYGHCRDTCLIPVSRTLD